ncbi:MAG: antiporter, partial [Candidatus Latescibacteria bacterium]|nr:antiporter [Candidatus Latescibacterota bacterium]
MSEWDPENETLWNESGKKHAMRNLWISIPCLLCGFAVWLYWSIIIVQMQNLSFPFSKDQLYTLTAVAGL